MKFKRWNVLTALLMTAVLSFSLTACGSTATEEEAPAEDTSKNYATAGGELALPAELVISPDANTLTAQLVGNQFMGGVTLTSYKPSRYFYIAADSITLTANFALYDRKTGEAAVTNYTDATVALWEKGTDKAIYIDTVHFKADGTTQSYTFSNLKSGGEYRISITYTDRAAYRLSGTFSVTPVSATGSEEEVAMAE